MARSTRFSVPMDPLQIFQDDMFEHPGPSISRAPMPSVSKHNSPRRALQSSDGNAIFNPPSYPGKPRSPFKNMGRGNARSPLGLSQGNKLTGLSISPPFSNNQTTDSMRKKQPTMSRFKPVAQKPTAADISASFGKENLHPTIYPAPSSFNINFEEYYQKVPGKRALLEAAPIKDSRPAKKTKIEEPSISSIPAPDSFPAIVDDGQKPSHSYAQLIGMAILRSPTRRLTLSQIYHWISATYSFYSLSDPGWQNSIRHNLSLNKSFVKSGRPKDDPGKGHYWSIEPGHELQYTKDKPSRKAAGTVESMSVMNMAAGTAHLEPSQNDVSTFADGVSSLPPVLPAQPVLHPQAAVPAHAAVSESIPEVSSDATIPMSDSAAPEEPTEEEQDREIPIESSTFSPLPKEMHSSPPVPRRLEGRSKTPPPIKREAPSSGTHKRIHKRKHVSMDAAATMDDSGYISSLESSAMRANHAGRLTSSGSGRRRIKRGRAEEEIARLRSSSYDSPTKTRSFGLIPPSSSPMRSSKENSQMLPPFTPAIKMKAPPKPPASVSPNTNLRIHRDNVRHMLNSPLRRVSNISNNIPWSPKFEMDDPLLNVPGLFGDPSDLDSIQDGLLESFFFTADNGSPSKRSARKPHFELPHPTGTLGEITNTACNKSITSAPFLKPPTPSIGLFYETPSKAFEGMSSPSKFLQSPLAGARSGQFLPAVNDDWTVLEDVCGLNVDPQFFEDENDDHPALDILQGFQKIGGSQPPARPSRPGIGRSYSTTF